MDEVDLHSFSALTHSPNKPLNTVYCSKEEQLETKRPKTNCQKEAGTDNKRYNSSGLGRFADASQLEAFFDSQPQCVACSLSTALFLSESLCISFGPLMFPQRSTETEVEKTK